MLRSLRVELREIEIDIDFLEQELELDPDNQELETKIEELKKDRWDIKEEIEYYEDKQARYKDFTNGVF